MSASPLISLKTGRDGAPDLVKLLEAQLDIEVVVETGEGERLAIGRDNTFYSVHFDPVLISLVAGATAIARELASVLVAYLRTRQRRLLIQRADGTTVDLKGYTQDEVERILRHAVAERTPPASEA